MLSIAEHVWERAWTVYNQAALGWNVGFVTATEGL